MSKRGRRKEEEHGHDERWLITYADMITLLLAVFIVLYSFSVLDLQKFEDMSGALGDAFHGSASGGVIGDGGRLMPGGPGIHLNRASFINEIRGAIDRHLPDALRDSIEISHRAGVVRISMQADPITFSIGRADLSDQARQMLDALGPSLRAVSAPMQIEGHTCDLPINTERFPSNWELSAQRATAVMTYLIRNCGVDPEYISTVGYADTKPLAPNDTEAGRQRNRRVDIVVLARDLPYFGTDHAESQLRVPGPGEETPVEPVHLKPTIDLQERHRQSTGRRGPDTPTSFSPGENR